MVIGLRGLLGLSSLKILGLLSGLSSPEILGLSSLS